MKITLKKITLSYDIHELTYTTYSYISPLTSSGREGGRGGWGKNPSRRTLNLLNFSNIEAHQERYIILSCAHPKNTGNVFEIYLGIT